MKKIITTNEAGLDIKTYLKSISMSASLIKKLKKLETGILVNGAHQNVTYILKENDVLETNFDDTEEETNKYLEPVDLPVEIIFESENMTVVNKSAAMPTHESINNRGNTLANALAYRYSDKPYVFRAVNRLDKDTSGAVVTANNKYYAGMLSALLKSGKTQKEYIAVVEGNLQGAGTVEAPIRRKGESIIERIVAPDGEYAKTHYEVLKSCDDISIVLVKPQTGRTHQIRVHMAHIGHPIVGDEMYGSTSEYISRQALHCLRMKIEGIGDFVAPLPQDMEQLIRRYFDEAII